MQLFNSEKGKLRKKDIVPYYYNSSKKFVEVPSMKDDRDKVYGFLKFCTSITHPEVSNADIDAVWVDAEDRQPALIEALDQLRAEHEGNNDLWKAKSYAKAIASIREIKVPILSGAQAQKLPNIGKGIAGVIDEVLRHGRLKTQEERMENAIERQNVTEQFLRIWGFTPKIANELYNFGNRSVKDLLEKSKEGKLTLDDTQILGLKYYEDFLLPVPREDVEKIVTNLKKELGSSALDVQAVGQYRRKVPEISEIDIAVKINKKSTKAVIKKISDTSGFKETSGISTNKFHAAVKIKGVARKVNVHVIQDTEWGVSQIILTGPDSFLKMMKEQAAVMGYSFGGKKGFLKLSETDDNDIQIDAPDEETVFKELGMKIVDPENRM